MSNTWQSMKLSLEILADDPLEVIETKFEVFDLRIQIILLHDQMIYNLASMICLQ